jgi:phage terminase large subunit GpA-like protein
MLWEQQLNELLDGCTLRLSDVEPAEWAEQRMKITSGKFQGPLSYDMTPFFREPINCLSPYHWAQRVVMMGGGQLGKSKTVIEPIIAYHISEHPCNILYLTGHSDLSEESMMKLDSAIDGAGLRSLIFKQTLSKKNTQTGDTKQRKEFPLGELISGSATNHKLLRQRDPRLIIADDIEAAKNSSKQSGSTVAMIEKRTNSYGGDKKILYVSTPELKQTSIIEPLFLQGDQRRYHIPCQCCGEMIVLKWEGFVWDLQDNLLVPGSVRYICQTCGDAFDDTNKYEFNLAGHWIPTAKPKDPSTVSFHLPGWYAAPFMDNWEANVREYLNACPPGGQIDKHLLKTFVNLTKAETYEDDFEEIKASKLQENINDYEPGIVPERISVKDGNGRIVLLTCAADLNGLEHDGRLDYSIIAWPENESPYVVTHGSIGTFKPAILKRKGDDDTDRAKWTYEELKPNCIWDEFEKVIGREYEVDSDIAGRRKIQVSITGVDVGVYGVHAHSFIDRMNNKGVLVQGVKGKGSGEYTLFLTNEHKVSKDARVVSKGVSAKNLWVIDVGYVKDDVHEKMGLRWGKNEEKQPKGFINFPHPGNGLFEWTNFFEHFESEKRVYVENKKGTNVIAQWEKKTSASQNHMWDCFIYNMVLPYIWIEILKEKYPENRKTITWQTYSDVIVRSLQSLS